ncbi:MAG: hypothetical protein IJ465_00895 [Clostridia bacterium]|nr:hypothetical protein [Clostridia bacterium]
MVNVAAGNPARHWSGSQSNGSVLHDVTSLLKKKVSFWSIDKIFDVWSNEGVSPRIAEKSKLIRSLLSVSENMVVYCTATESKIKEIIVTSPTFDKRIFDEVTRCIIRYEDALDEDVYYYYVEESDLKNAPEGAEVYK